MEQWISDIVTIPVQNILINVDSSCTVIISSFDDRECQELSEGPILNSSNIYAAIIGGTISCLLLFLIIAVFTVAGLLWLRKRRPAYFKNSRYAKI